MAWLQQPLIRACRGAAGRRAMSAAVTKADVVIVGSGIMGLNIAYQLKKRDPTLAVTILEQSRDLGFGSSGYSTGFQRIFYTFDTTMQFAATGTQVSGERSRPFSREIASFGFFGFQVSGLVCGVSKPVKVSWVMRSDSREWCAWSLGLRCGVQGVRLQVGAFRV